MFRGHKTQAPTSVGCDAEQGALFYSAGQHGKLRQAKLMELKSKERIWKKIKVNEPVRYKLDKEQIPDSGRSMRGYILTCSRL